MLDLDHQIARMVGPGPGLVEVIGLLLLDPVVAVDLEALAVVTFQIRVGWRLAEAADVGREMAVEDGERISGVGMLVESMGQQYVRAQRKQPTVIVGEIRNLSHEHINVNTFVADMERSLINSGKVEFVASRTERQDVREEREDQDLHAREDTRKAMGQEIGADFMLKGTINTIVDPSGTKQVRYYQVNLTLISMADNRKVWVGQKKIKKFVEKNSIRW